MLLSGADKMPKDGKPGSAKKEKCRGREKNMLTFLEERQFLFYLTEAKFSGSTVYK